MPEISDLQNWCNHTRVILDKTGKDSRGRMKERTDDVAKLLVKLKSMPAFQVEYADLFGQFEVITARARQAETVADKTGVAAASRDLSILKKTLRVQLAQDPTASKSVKKAGSKAEDKLEGTKGKQWVGEKDTRDKESEAARLEPLANTVQQDPLMTQVPRDATAPEILTAGLAVARAAVTSALKTRDTRSETDVDGARQLLDAVRLAIQAAEAAAVVRLEKDRLDGLANTVRTDPLMIQVPKANDQELLSAGVPAARQAVIDALKDRDTRASGDIDIARGLLDAVRLAIEAAELAAAPRLEKERILAAAHLVRDDPLMSQVPKDANAKEIQTAGLAVARQAVLTTLKGDDNRIESDITAAKLLLPAVRQAIEAAELAAATRIAKGAYDTRYSQILPLLQEAWKLKDLFGVPADKKTALVTAYNESSDLKKASKWVPAKAKLDDVESSAQAVKDVYTAGKGYFDAFKLMQAEFDAALDVYFLKAAKLAVPSAAFEKIYGDVVKQTKKPDWVAAKNGVPAFKAACITLRDAGAAAIAEKPAFDLAYKSITGLPAAQTIAKNPPASLATELQTFQQRLEAVNAAKIAGDYAVAKNAIPALQNAIINLSLANAGVNNKKREFEEELAKIAGYAEAKALAAANAASVLAKIPAFTLADGNVNAQVKLQEWSTAKGLVAPALATATLELLAAKGTFNSGYSTQQKTDFKEKMKVLKPRTDPAATPGPTPFITTQKAAVKKTTDAIGVAITGTDWATAERLHAQLLLELPKLETALSDYEAHLITFNAAKNGEVKTARDFALTPPKLAQERTKALAATELRIKHFADKGSVTTKANPMVATWVEEAKAWKAAQAASDNLNSGGEPDANAMKTLAALPGGTKVLDALVAGLPEGRPEKFLREVMKQRFGVNVKQFTSKNESSTDLSGLTKISSDAPDKSLKKIYEMFAKVPAKNVKGKVRELIHFDVDEGGAAAGGKKIYMYCGRADDPNGSKQKFGQGVVNEGEEIEDDFKAATGNGIPDELPYFDFATLHEVGHAVDDAAGVMKVQGVIAGWTKETPASIAAKAAVHFKYNVDYIREVLASATSTPPTTVYAPEGGVSQIVWDKARDEALNWCKSVRVGMKLWNNPALSKHVAIAGVVYQESYDGDWFSYNIAARAKGITSYQFRSPAEWFAELYAAFFSGKLKKTHPYAAWLKPLKKLA